MLQEGAKLGGELLYPRTRSCICIEGRVGNIVVGRCKDGSVREEFEAMEDVRCLCYSIRCAVLDEAPSEVVFDFGVSARRHIQRQRSSSAAAGWRQVNKPRLSQLRRCMTFEERETSHGVVVLCAICEGTSG